MPSPSSCRVILLVLWLPIVFSSSGEAQQSMLQRIESASEQQLRQFLRRYPAADTNGDGVLSRNEARGYAQLRMSAQTSKSDRGGGQTGNEISEPDFVDVIYGDHPRHRFDVWKAQVKTTRNEQPQPMVVFIHGGGFQNGDKASWRRRKELRNVLNAGYAAAAINYPFRNDRPIQTILKDVASAIQLLRSRSTKYQFDPAVMIGWGGSAGAGTAFWLTVRDDLADPENANPVLRQSSRLQAAILNSTQATYDLTRWDALIGPAKPEWWQSQNEMAQFYHFENADQFSQQAGQQVLKECDMLQWVSSDDGPLWISNPVSKVAPKNRGQYLHHFRHAEAIAEVCERHNVTCQLIDGKSKRQGAIEFIARVLNEDEN